jgi:hypothetical protein
MWQDHHTHFARPLAQNTSMLRHYHVIDLLIQHVIRSVIHIGVLAVRFSS